MWTEKIPNSTEVKTFLEILGSEHEHTGRRVCQFLNIVYTRIVQYTELSRFNNLLLLNQGSLLKCWVIFHPTEMWRWAINYAHSVVLVAILKVRAKI